MSTPERWFATITIQAYPEPGKVLTVDETQELDYPGPVSEATVYLRMFDLAKHRAEAAGHVGLGWNKISYYAKRERTS